MKTFYITKNQYKSPGLPEKNELPSETIPGDALTIQQLLEKYAAGQMLDMHTPVYMDADIDHINEFHRNPGALDLTDLANLGSYVEYLQEEINRRLGEAEKLGRIDQEPTLFENAIDEAQERAEKKPEKIAGKTSKPKTADS